MRSNHFLKVKIILIILLGAIHAHNGSAQSLSGGDIEQLRKSFVSDPQTVAIGNILKNNKDIRSLALDNKVCNATDHFFKYRVDVSGITDQKRTDRCWMFTSMNVLRPSVIERYNLHQFDFSHNYLYFWDILEKSNLFLENIIATAGIALDDRTVSGYFRSPVSEGGVWNLYYNLGEKYGVVPKEVMPETEHSENTAQMRALIIEKLRKEGLAIREMLGNDVPVAKAREYKKEVLQDIYRILALCLGEPPTEFTWRYTDRDGNLVERKYTPSQFYMEITPDGYGPQNYIMIMNDPLREYYKLYELENYRSVYEGVSWIYLNLPNDVIKKAALASIKNNEAMYASCDVGKQHNRETGVADVGMYDYGSLLGVDFAMDKKARILTYQSGSAHAMTLMACDTDANDVPVKWQFENSWGEGAGNKGYMTFTDRWFDEYMFRIVIHRKYLDPASLGALDQEPVKLDPWDYMY